MWTNRGLGGWDLPVEEWFLGKAWEGKGGNTATANGQGGIAPELLPCIAIAKPL